MVEAGAAELEPLFLFVPAEAHRVADLVQRLEEAQVPHGHLGGGIETGIVVSDDGAAGRAVEGFQHVGGGDLVRR